VSVQQFSTPAEIRAWTREQRKAGKTVGFVPTMGALHDGHRSLIAAACAECDEVVVSIFVNPTQFDNPEDLENYPNMLADDLGICTAAGVGAVFTPDRDKMYPNGYATFVDVVGNLTDKLCAVARPGHFRGVATVVTKLFNAVVPDVAFFGQKDLQQALVISRMVSDLDMGVEVRVCPTVREPDGLAMSSRNRRLSEEGREKALALPRGLEMANQAYAAGERDSNKLIEILAMELLVHTGVDLDYAQVVSLTGFEEVDEVKDSCVLAAAAFVDEVRLIDHIHLGGPALPVSLD
jgi:pantoate--beta-alanine ligase